MKCSGARSLARGRRGQIAKLVFVLRPAGSGEEGHRKPGPWAARMAWKLRLKRGPGSNPGISSGTGEPRQYSAYGVPAAPVCEGCSSLSSPRRSGCIRSPVVSEQAGGLWRPAGVVPKKNARSHGSGVGSPCLCPGRPEADVRVAVAPAVPVVDHRSAGGVATGTLGPRREAPDSSTCQGGCVLHPARRQFAGIGSVALKIWRSLGAPCEGFELRDPLKFTALWGQAQPFLAR